MDAAGVFASWVSNSGSLYHHFTIKSCTSLLCKVSLIKLAFELLQLAPKTSIRWKLSDDKLGCILSIQQHQSAGPSWAQVMEGSVLRNRINYGPFLISLKTPCEIFSHQTLTESTIRIRLKIEVRSNFNHELFTFYYRPFGFFNLIFVCSVIRVNKNKIRIWWKVNHRFIAYYNWAALMG